MAYDQANYAQPRRRPIGVTILAILLILGGLLFILISIAVLFFSVLLIPSVGYIGVAVGVVVLILSILILATGFALLSLRPWAWWLAVIVLFLNLAAQGYLYYSGLSTSLVGVIIPGLIFVYLIAVRKHFR